MKRITILLLLSLIGVSSVQSQNYDFSSVCPSGQTLFYKIISPNNVEVVYPNYCFDCDSTFIGTFSIPADTIDGICYPNVSFPLDWRTSYYAGYSSPSGNLIIPSSVINSGVTYTITSIGECAFNFCVNLESVVLPNTIIAIQDDAFAHCLSLSSIIIPEGVMTIGRSTFFLCANMQSIQLPPSITSIGKYAFSACYSLLSLQIPDNITIIDTGFVSFESCPATGRIHKITMPSHLNQIRHLAFSHCPFLEEIRFKNSQSPIIATNAFLESYTRRHFYVPCGSSEDYYRLHSFYNVISEDMYNIDILVDTSRGIVTIDSLDCAHSNMTAIANEGFHFSHWSDGNTSNPRSIELFQDTSFSAVFENDSVLMGLTFSAISPNGQTLP